MAKKRLKVIFFNRPVIGPVAYSCVSCRECQQRVPRLFILAMPYAKIHVQRKSLITQFTCWWDLRFLVDLHSTIRSSGTASTIPGYWRISRRAIPTAWKRRSRSWRGRWTILPTKVEVRAASSSSVLVTAVKDPREFCRNASERKELPLTFPLSFSGRTWWSGWSCWRTAKVCRSEELRERSCEESRKSSTTIDANSI